jgi:hypothetical protein
VKLSRRALWSLLTLLISLPLYAETTWYVRPDGGTRYSTNARKGQCDGKADAAYRGSGVNQHCAFNDYRYLYDDQSYGNSAWVIAGGDTVIIRGGPWRVGFATNNNAHVWCIGGQGPYSCSNPPLPAGTPSQHTRILGENHGSCSQSKMTQLYGGFGVGVVLNLGGAQYVDVECLELTRHSQCIEHGDPRLPSDCNRDFPGTDDYATEGITTNVKTHDLLLQDMWIHRFPDRGIIGPIGGTVTANRVDIAFNGMAGWDFDDGSGSNKGNGTANLPGSVWNFNYSTIEWSGCNEVYPGTGAISCYGQSNGGYGDGVGTPPGTCLTANIDHSTFRYNVQDGLDLGHIDTGKCSMTITNSTAYGNGGGTFKWGPNENPATLMNNTVIANCMRMSAPIQGAAPAYNAHLGDFCRAGDAVSFNFRQGGRAFFANNTFVTYSPATFDTQCWDAPGVGSGSINTGCGDSTLIFKNNIVLGYDNPHTYELGGKPGGPIFFYFRDNIGHIDRANNLYFGIRNLHCPTGHPNERCGDPKFVSQPRFSKEQDLDNFNFHLSDTSPARGTGIRIPEVQIDFLGKPRPSSGGYDIGAFQY